MAHFEAAVEIIDQLNGVRGGATARISLEAFSKAIATDSYYRHLDRLVFVF